MKSSFLIPDGEDLAYACAARSCENPATVMVPALRTEAEPAPGSPEVRLTSVTFGDIVLDVGAAFAVPLCDRHAREF